MSLSTANKIQRPSGTILIANVKLKLALVIYILYIFLVILPRSVQTKKAEDLGKFFSSVFTVEQEQSSSSLPVKRYDTICYFNVRSKADISQLNLPHGTDN